MKTFLIPGSLLGMVFATPSYCSTQTPTIPTSTRSQAAILLYILIKLIKKTTVIKELEDHYETLRTAEKSMLGHGIGNVLLELCSTPTQTNLLLSALDGIGHILTGFCTRFLHTIAVSTEIGQYCQNKLEKFVIPEGFEELWDELVIGVANFILYTHLKKYIPPLVPA